MKLLLISNSTNAGEEYLRYPLPEIGRFLQGVREIVFVPYAAVTFSYAEYERRVQARFAELGIRVRSVHRAGDPAALVRRAEAICVGGGNTFALAKKMQQQGLMQAILRRIRTGVPYVGWEGAVERFAVSPEARATIEAQARRAAVPMTDKVMDTVKGWWPW